MYVHTCTREVAGLPHINVCVLSVRPRVPLCPELAIKDGTAWDQCWSKPCIECKQLQDCPPVHPTMPWEPPPPPGKAMVTSSCQCSVTKFGSCTFSPEPCPTPEDLNGVGLCESLTTSPYYVTILRHYVFL